MIGLVNIYLNLSGEAEVPEVHGLGLIQVGIRNPSLLIIQTQPIDNASQYLR